MQQLSLFEEVLTIQDTDEFFQASVHGELDSCALMWSNNRAFMANKSLFSIITVAQLTDIPAWRNLCTHDDQIKAVEASPRTGLFIKLYGGNVHQIATNVSELLSYYELHDIFPHWKG